MELFRMAILLPVLMLSKALGHPLRLSQNCSGVVETFHQEVWRPVIFDNASAEWEKAAKDLCTYPSCGAVYKLGHSDQATLKYNSSTCLSQCVYRDLLVENCTELSHPDCTNLTEITCGHQAVRLAGGADHCTGRVELWKEGQWGTVCDDSWDWREGNVVCAQLGCGSAWNVSGESWSFKAGAGLILLDELNCGGDENNLWECPSKGTPNDCGHKEDAAVVCSGFQLNQTDNETQTIQISTTEGSVPTVTSTESLSFPITPAVWSCIALSIALLLTILSNALLYLFYKKRAALWVHQSPDGQLLSIQSQPTEQDEGVNLLTVATATAPQNPYQRPFHNDTDVSFNCDNVHSLKSASTSSGECYETLDDELLISGPTATILPDCGRKSSFGSSSTSSGESYENLVDILENLHPAKPNVSTPVQPTSSHQDQPGDSYFHQLSKQDQVHSLKSASTSSGECYENIETLDDELLVSGPTETVLPDYGRKSSFGSSSTSSGESYENLVDILETLHPEEPNVSTPVQPTGTHQDQPGDSYFHQLSKQDQDQDDSSSSSSSDLYENIEVNGGNKCLYAATIKEDPNRSLSDSDYDDITTY